MDIQALLHLDGSDNTSGIGQYIFVAKIEDIAVLPVPVLDDSTGTGTFADLVTITQNIVMLAGKSFHKIYVTLEAGELKSETQGELDGISFLNQLEFFHPGSQAEVLGFAQWAKNSSLVFLVPEVDGAIRLLGHRAYPAKMVSSPFTTGKASADRKGGTFTFKSSRKGPAPIFTGRVDLIGSGIYDTGGAMDFQDIYFVD